MEAICIHDVTEEFGKGRAEPAIEEHGEEGIFVRAETFGRRREDSGARMCLRLRRPEEVESLPQLSPGERWGEDSVLPPQRRDSLRLGRFRRFPRVCFGSHGGSGAGGSRASTGSGAAWI